MSKSTSSLLTGCNVHDVVESVFALDDVHHQPGEAHVVLGEQRVDGGRLDNVVHEEEALGVLEAALGQVSSGPVFLQRTALISREQDIFTPILEPVPYWRASRQILLNATYTPGCDVGSTAHETSAGECQTYSWMSLGVKCRSGVNLVKIVPDIFLYSFILIE